MTQKKQANGKKRALLAGGSLLVVGALATAAAFTDFANLNLAGGNGIGGNNRFNIQVVDTDPVTNAPIPGQWQEANTEQGVDFLVVNGDIITPGDTVSVEIPFRNESPVLSADMGISLQDRPGYTSDAIMADALRYTVSLDGTALISNATQAQVSNIDLGVYKTHEEGTLKIEMTLPDQGSEAANNALQEKAAYVQAHFDAESVIP